MRRASCDRGPALLLALLAPLGLLAPAPAAAQGSCSSFDQTQFVRDVLFDIYYWNRELPASDPALFDSPEAYLEAVRFRPLDSSFSYIAGRAASDAFFSDSQFIGFGFAVRIENASEARFSAVFPDGPAAEAGLLRGDRLLAVDGRPVPELLAEGSLTASFGPSQIGVEAVLEWADASGERRAARLVKRLVTIPTVSLTRVFDLDGRRVGYLHFRNFVAPSIAALDAAFAELVREGAQDLVLDLRYNGGGFVSVAQHLSGLIGGTLTFAQVFARYQHNDRNRFRDQTLRFPRPDRTLELRRLVVITTRSSASASELLVNGLRPFMQVTLVGDATFGKPVGQYGVNFCDKVLFPVSFSIRNARDQGDYFGGIPADCPADDDIDHALGDPAEASLATALGFLRTGECPGGGAQATARRFAQPPGDPWQQLLGAH